MTLCGAHENNVMKDGTPPPPKLAIRMNESPRTFRYVFLGGRNEITRLLLPVDLKNLCAGDIVRKRRFPILAVNDQRQRCHVQIEASQALDAPAKCLYRQTR